MSQQLRIRPHPDLQGLLTALGIPWAIYSNGTGDWVDIFLSDEADDRLLELWDQLTSLRWQYVEQRQRGQATQLALPMEGCHG